MRKKLFLILILPILALVGAWFWRGVFATSNPHTWTNGLVGYWSFDGQYTTSTDGTKDVSNTGNYGRFNGGVKPIAGVVGQGLSFDGVDDSVEAADSASLDVDYLSIEAWVRSASSTMDQAIVTKWSDADIPADNRSFRLTLKEPSTPIIDFKACLALNPNGLIGVSGVVCSNTILNIAQWYHVVATYDGNYTKIYINGVFENQTAYSSGIYKGSYPLRIGQRSTSSVASFFNGSIDEVRIYNRALSADEVKQHYDQTKRNLVVNQSSGTPPVGWWKLDGGNEETIAKDSSVNANNGTTHYLTTSTYGWVDGKIGKALSFDGVNGNNVEIPNSTPLNISGNQMVIETWVNPSETPVSTKYIISKGWADQYGLVFTSVNTIKFEVGLSPSNYCSVTSTGTIPLNAWSHLAGVYDGTNINIYINGKLDKQSPCVITIAAKTYVVRIGGNYFCGIVGSEHYWYCFNGLIDDMRIYNVSRTAAQIYDDYRAGAYRTIVATSVPSTWWTGGLVGYWNFDGQNTTSTNGTKDSTTNNNWGVFNNGVKPIAGISGQALFFDGVNDYVNMGNPASLQLTTAITIEAWVQRDWTTAVVGGNERPIHKREIVARGYGVIFNTNKTFQFILANGTSARAIFSTTVINTGNNWHHIVSTYDGDKMRFYLDGVIDTTGATDVFTIDATVDNFYISWNSAPWKGKIDEVRIYNRALSAGEVMQHYQQTRRNLGM